MAKKQIVGTAFSKEEKEKTQAHLEALMKKRKSKGRLEVVHKSDVKKSHRWEFWYVED